MAFILPFSLHDPVLPLGTIQIPIFRTKNNPQFSNSFPCCNPAVVAPGQSGWKNLNTQLPSNKFRPLLRVKGPGLNQK